MRKCWQDIAESAFTESPPSNNSVSVRLHPSLPLLFVKSDRSAAISIGSVKKKVQNKIYFDIKCLSLPFSDVWRFFNAWKRKLVFLKTALSLDFRKVLPTLVKVSTSTYSYFFGQSSFYTQITHSLKNLIWLFDWMGFKGVILCHQWSVICHIRTCIEICLFLCLSDITSEKADFQTAFNG